MKFALNPLPSEVPSVLNFTNILFPVALIMAGCGKASPQCIRSNGAASDAPSYS